MYGFGIIGCGMIAKTHIAAIADIADAKLVGVFDKNQAAGNKFAQENNTIFFESLEDMLSNKEIDIVTICTPSGLHADLTIKALEAGKNVVVEKPMALTAEDCDRVIEAEKNSGKICAVVSQLRFSDVAHQVKNAIADGKLGDIVEVGLHMKYHRDEEYYSSSNWRGTYSMDGGGALMNQGIHGVDMLINFLGMPESVFAFCRTKRHNIEVEDTAVAVLEYKNGPIGVIEATTSVNPGYPRQLEICGTKGSIILEENTIKSWDIDGETMDSEALQSRSFNDPSAISHYGHKLEFEDLIDAIKNNRKPLIDTTEGKKSVELIRAIYESSQNDKKIIIKGDN